MADALVAEGWNVRCTVRKTSNLRWIESLPVDRITLDVSSPVDLAAAFEGVDVVGHVAIDGREELDTHEEHVHHHGIGHDEGQTPDGLVPWIELREPPQDEGQDDQQAGARRKS